MPYMRNLCKSLRLVIDTKIAKQMCNTEPIKKQFAPNNTKRRGCRKKNLPSCDSPF